MLESFIKHTFCASDTPGTKQVQSGRYIVSPSNRDSKALNKANWSSNIFPGAELTMTIVLSMLKMPVRKCPKPSCGQPVPDVTELREFVTCQACGLYFRFNPDTKHFGINTEDEMVDLIHQDEDLSKFGRRHVPPDVVEGECEEYGPPDKVSPLAIFSPMADMELKQPLAQTLTSENLSKLGMVSTEEIGNIKIQLVGLDFPQLPSVDWNSGPSGMAAWLNSSAAPAHDSEYFGPDPDTFQMEIEQLQQEQRDIESLRRVHFVSTIPESQPLNATVEEYHAMPLDTQIYVRKIVDRFPTAPSFLAKRFAHANAGRLNRLRDQKQKNAEGLPPQIRLDPYLGLLKSPLSPLSPPEATIWPQKLAGAKYHPRTGHSDGRRTEHGSSQHVLHAKGNKRKAYVCVDVSPNATMLAGCPECRDGKTYDAYYKAATHLRKKHFDLPERSKHKSGRPENFRTATPMHVLKGHIKQVQP